MGSTRTTSVSSLASELERDRLERRVRRITIVIARLRERAGEHPGEGKERPRHLRRAIADFEAQLEAINGRLRDLTPAPVSNHQRWSDSDERSP
jgi:hypothetical protein